MRRCIWADPRSSLQCSLRKGQSLGVSGLSMQSDDSKFLRKTMKRYGRPETMVTDKLGSYRAALRTIGNGACQETGRWLNNRAENSHQPLRRREWARQRFRQIRTLQKFAAVHSSVHNHFNQERHLYSRENFKLNRAAALAEWRELSAA